MDEDEVLSKITRLLEQGCTMLASHHDCGAPLFRCQGEVVCPVCSYPDGPLSVVQAKGPDTASQLHRSGSGVEPLSQHEIVESLPRESAEKESVCGEREDVELIRAKATLRASLLRRLRELTVALEVEQDLDRLKKQLDCIEGLLRAFRSMQG